jgi:hypothetical protein
MSTLPIGRAKLYWLIEHYLSDHHDVGTFCKEFERTYNFEIDRSKLSVDELREFGDLFNKVTVYSPFEDDLKTIPMYKSGHEIREAVMATRSKLRMS